MQTGTGPCFSATKLGTKTVILGVSALARNDSNFMKPTRGQTGCMHGGSVSALIDYTNCWNASMFAKDGRYHPSTFNSRSLNLAFLKPIHMGTTVRVRSRPVSIGKTMAYCETTVESLDGKIIYATGQHHFYCFPQGPESVKKLQAEFEASMEQAKRNLQSGPSL